MVSAADFNVALEGLADRTAWLKARLPPDVQTFTANGTWTKPAGAIFCDFVVVAQGGAPSAATLGAGGDGGRGGEIKTVRLPASLVPASLAINLANGAFSFGATATDGAGFLILAIAAGGAAAGLGGPRGTGGGAGTPGGNGGAGVANAAPAGGTPGAAAGAAPFAQGGAAGRGYGGGAGGGGGDSSLVGGGGGGAGGGGYGSNAVATAGGAGASGVDGAPGTAAPGVVIVTTWRG